MQTSTGHASAGTTPHRIGPLTLADPASRLVSIDLVRGLVMVLMALDHTRDYFHYQVNAFDPGDLTRTSVALFLTRWVTHFCAPAFFFLAGTGAFLSAARGKPRREVQWFLLTRGFWLVVLELTVVRLSWEFGYDFRVQPLLVIWALGWSMVALAGLLYLPLWGVAGVSGLMVAGHNLLDGVAPAVFGSAGWLWQVLHVPGVVQAGGVQLFVLYPLVPWIGVMGLGYAFGALLRSERARADRAYRRQVVLRLGLGAVALFVAVRALNVYGDASRWSAQESPVFTVLSFLNTTKYPPSLLYLLMTLGPILLGVALLENARGRVADFFVVFGRVPLFYYLLHIPLIHFLSGLAFAADNGTREMWVMPFMRTVHRDWGYGLPAVYAAWVLVVLLLYPVCRWFAGVKRRRREWWIGYL